MNTLPFTPTGQNRLFEIASVADRATPHTVLDIENLSIEQAEERGAYWLEDRAGFSRYWIGADESAWACQDCGTFGGSPDDGDGCPMCGFGAEDGMEG